MGACIQGRMVRFALETIRGRVSFFVNIKIWAPFYNPIVPDIDPHNSLSRWSQGLNMRDNKECSHTPPRDLCAYNFIIFACTLAKKCIVIVKKTFADAVKNTRHNKMLYNNKQSVYVARDSLVFFVFLKFHHHQHPAHTPTSHGWAHASSLNEQCRPAT